MLKYVIASVVGPAAAKDGSEVAVVCRWEDGEAFMLALPPPVANLFQIALQDAAADAALFGAREIQPALAESVEIQPSRFEGLDLMTVLVGGGARLQFLVPTGQGENRAKEPGA